MFRKGGLCVCIVSGTACLVFKNVKNQAMSVRKYTHSCRSENKIISDLVTALFVHDKWEKFNWKSSVVLSMLEPAKRLQFEMSEFFED
jgi:hypothetical protein